ncbi:MAG: hypothetical protein KF713_16600 [Turneriella sp.]|nr:hypothetical protein [Turneriella sp.]
MKHEKLLGIFRRMRSRFFLLASIGLLAFFGCTTMQTASPSGNPHAPGIMMKPAITPVNQQPALMADSHSSEVKQRSASKFGLQQSEAMPQPNSENFLADAGNIARDVAFVSTARLEETPRDNWLPVVGGAIAALIAAGALIAYRNRKKASI